MQDEAGDLLFTLVNLCRFVRVDAEAALRDRFVNSPAVFPISNGRLPSGERPSKESSQAEMDRIWEEAKKGGSQRRP